MDTEFNKEEELEVVSDLMCEVIERYKKLGKEDILWLQKVLKNLAEEPISTW